MKKNTAYTIGSLVILLICAFCFVILPALTGSGQSQAKLPAFGKYDGKEIAMYEGSDMQVFAANYSNMLQQYGQQIDDSATFQILNLAFNSTASKYAYQDFVKNSGYVVSDFAIRNGMIPYFYDESGKYSSKLYKQVPDTTKREIRDSVEDNLYTTRFVDDNFGSNTDIIGLQSLYGIKESNAELDFIQDYNRNQRGFKMAYFPLAEYPTEEIVKYGKANPDKFIKYDMSVITVEDKATADTVARRIANKEIEFADAVNEYSTKTFGDTTGKITTGYQYSLEEMLANKEDISKIKALALDAVSEVIETSKGFSIFKNDGAVVNPNFDSTETVDVVSSYLTSYESTLIEDYFTEKANILIAEAKKTDFESACTTTGVAYTDVAPFPLNYGKVSIASSLNDQAIPALANANMSESFLTTAFSLKLNEYSKPFVLNRNVIVLQYTQASEGDEESIFNAGELKSFDEGAAQKFVLDSDKFENNFVEVYFNNFMSH